VQVRARETGDLVICSLVLYEAVVRSIECEGLCLWLMASVRKRVTRGKGGVFAVVSGSGKGRSCGGGAFKWL
jgi:hypothetical protein